MHRFSCQGRGGYNSGKGRRYIVGGSLRLFLSDGVGKRRIRDSSFRNIVSDIGCGG